MLHFVISNLRQSACKTTSTVASPKYTLNQTNLYKEKIFLKHLLKNYKYFSSKQAPVRLSIKTHL